MTGKFETESTPDVFEAAETCKLGKFYVWVSGSPSTNHIRCDLYLWPDGYWRGEVVCGGKHGYYKTWDEAKSAMDKAIMEGIAHE